MNVRTVILSMAVPLGLLTSSIAAGQELLVGLTYTCNGERMFLEFCPSNPSDDAKCMVGHPDRPEHNGMTDYTQETRGSLKKLIATCKPPSPEAIARLKAMEKKGRDSFAATLAERGPASYAPPPPTQLQREEAEIRECIESGRSSTQCTGETMGKSLSGMMSDGLGMAGRMGGIDLSAAAAAAKRVPPPGLYLTGDYKSGRGFTAVFSQESVSIACGPLVPEPKDYSVEMNGNRAVVKIRAAPPIALTFGPDGRLTGPAVIDLQGHIIVGYSRQRYVDSRTGADAGSDSIPILRAHTEHCAIGALTGSSSGPQTTLTIAMDLFDHSSIKVIPPGLRVNGEYQGPGGFGIKFHTDAAMLRCGEATVAHDYIVEQKDDQVLLALQDARPIVLTYRPDGTFAGSGPIQVNGRKLIGTNANGDPAFSPRVGNCTMGILAPKGSALAIAAASAPVAAPLANAVLSVTSGFPVQPGTANPLEGRILVLLRESLDVVLSNGGFKVPAGMVPFNAMTAACRNHAPDCQTAGAAINAGVVSGAKIAANGNGIFPGVAPGTYYLMVSTFIGSRQLLWNLKIDLKPGANAVTLDQRNATPLN